MDLTDSSDNEISDKTVTHDEHEPDDDEEETDEVIAEQPAVEAIPAPPWPPTEFSSPQVLAAQKKSLSSLQRSLVLCHEMDAHVKHTAEKLVDGANKFQMMEDQQTEMEKDLIETADNFEDMNRCWGLCPWFGRKRRGPVEDAPDAPPPVPLLQSRSTIQPGSEDLKPISLVIIPHDHVELQMEYELELVEGFVDQLEQMSTDIQAKLTMETEIIDTVTDKIDKNIIRVMLARHKAQAVLQAI